MTDIVERLRTQQLEERSFDLRCEAADKIEHLLARLEEDKGEVNHLLATIADLHKRVQELEKENERLLDASDNKSAAWALCEKQKQALQNKVQELESLCVQNQEIIEKQTNSLKSLKSEVEDWLKDNMKAVEELEEKLLEGQAREAKLRECLMEMYCGSYQDYSSPDNAAMSGMPINPDAVLKAAFALPQDDSALQEVIKQARKEALLEAADELMNKDIDLGLWLQRKAEEQK